MQFLLAAFYMAAAAIQGVPMKSESLPATVERLSPSTFRQLPPRISAYLTRRGCTIPQSFEQRTPHNVISGEFIERGHRAWAVLCSRSERSAILVFKGSASRPAAMLAEEADQHYLQSIGPGGRVAYSRLISSVSPNDILGRQGAYDGPSFDHDGIVDAFAGKASVVRYCFAGKWLALAGAD